MGEYDGGDGKRNRPGESRWKGVSGRPGRLHGGRTTGVYTNIDGQGDGGSLTLEELPSITQTECKLQESNESPRRVYIQIYTIIRSVKHIISI